MVSIAKCLCLLVSVKVQWNRNLLSLGSDEGGQRTVDPVEHGVVVPEVSAPHLRVGRQQRGIHRGLGASVTQGARVEYRIGSQNPVVTLHCVLRRLVYF